MRIRGGRGPSVCLAVLLCAHSSGCAFFTPALAPATLEARIAPDRPVEPPARGAPPVEPPEPRQAGPDASPAPKVLTIPTIPTIPTMPPPRRLALAEVLDFAEKLSPRLEAVRAELARAEGGRRVAFSAFLPEIDARYRHIEGTESFALPTLPTLVGNVAYAGESDRFRQAELAVQWVVWDFGRTPGRFGRSDAARDIAALELARARQTVRFDATAAYFALLRAQALRRIAEQAVRTAAATLRDAENFLAEGTALREQVQRAEVQLARMQLDLVRARTEEGIATADLNRTVGFLVTAPTKIADVTDHAVAEPDFSRPLADCLRLAVDHRDELRIALRAIESAQLGVGIAQADFLPRVVVGGTGIHVDRDGPEIEENVFTGGVGLELALFQGGRRLGELVNADAELRLAIARAEEVCDAIAFEVVAAHLLVAEARERIRLGRIAVRHARENLRVERDLLRSGDATATDMVDAELVLIRSEQEYFDALYGYQTALARMVYATGTRRSVEDHA